MKRWRFDGFGKLKLIIWSERRSILNSTFAKLGSLVSQIKMTSCALFIGWSGPMKGRGLNETTRAHVLQEGKLEWQHFDQAEFKTLPTLSVWFVVFFEFTNTLRWKSSSRAQRWSTYWWPVALLAVLARELFLAALERCWRAVVCTLLPSKSTPT